MGGNEHFPVVLGPKTQYVGNVVGNNFLGQKKGQKIVGMGPGVVPPCEGPHLLPSYSLVGLNHLGQPSIAESAIKVVKGGAD